MIKKGTYVRANKFHSEPGKGLTYGEFTGFLLEDCNGEGWDVVDIQRVVGWDSVYSFSVEAYKGNCEHGTD